MKKILVVEDEYYARKSIVKILQESDLDIQVCGEAENGMKAIELLEEYKDIALVITDIQMQKMGGLELASYLHKHIPEIDVLILTAFENFDYAREALRYNVKDYIVKPIYKENLLPPVKKVLEKQEEKSRNQEKIKNYYQWEAAKNYFPVKTIVAHEELYKEFFSYNAIHQEEKFCIVVMQEEELVTDVELVNRIIQEKYRGFIKDFFFSKINEEYVMLLSGIECMDNELIVQEKVESMLSYFCTCKHMNITIDETMAALEEMKRKGYIRYVGVSNFTAEQIKEAEQYIQIDVQQPLYSMVDRGFEDLMSWGYDRGIDSMTYGSMGAGILSGKIRSVPSFEKNDLRLNFYDVYKEPKFSKIMELLKVMDSIADGHNVPVGQVALNWSTQKEYVGTALVGVRSIEHADENCKTFDWKLTEEEMKILDSKIEECAL